MSKLHDKLAAIIPPMRDEIRGIIKEHGDKVMSSVTVKQAYGGMRGVKGLVCDTSEVPPDKGLVIRGIPLKELTDKLPEEIFWLLCTGELPTKDELADFQKDLMKRGDVPDYVWKCLEALPKASADGKVDWPIRRQVRW